jgi:hypothetical protein
MKFRILTSILLLFSWQLIAQTNNYIFIENISAPLYSIYCDGNAVNIEPNNFCLIHDLSEGQHHIRIDNKTTKHAQQFAVNVSKSAAAVLSFSEKANVFSLIAKDDKITVIEENVTNILNNVPALFDDTKQASYQDIIVAANSNTTKKHKGLFGESKDGKDKKKFSGAPVQVYYPHLAKKEIKDNVAAVDEELKVYVEPQPQSKNQIKKQEEKTASKIKKEAEKKSVQNIVKNDTAKAKPKKSLFKTLFAESADGVDKRNFTKYNYEKPNEVRPATANAVEIKTNDIIANNLPSLEDQKRLKAEEEKKNKDLEIMRYRQSKIDEEREVANLEKQKQDLLKQQEAKLKLEASKAEVERLLKADAEAKALALKMAEENKVAIKKAEEERNLRVKTEAAAKVAKQKEIAEELKRKDALIAEMKRKKAIEQDSIKKAEAIVKNLAIAKAKQEVKTKVETKAKIEPKKEIVKPNNNPITKPNEIMASNNIAVANLNKLKLEAKEKKQAEERVKKIANDSLRLEIKKSKVAEAKRINDSLTMANSLKKEKLNTTEAEKLERLYAYSKAEDLKKLKDLEDRIAAEEEALKVIRLEQERLKNENKALQEAASKITVKTIDEKKGSNQINDTKFVDNTKSMEEHRSNLVKVKDVQPKLSEEKIIEIKERKNITANKNCSTTIQTEQLEDLFKKLEGKVDDDARLAVIKKMVAKSKYCFYCKDIEQLSQSFNTQNGKYDFIKQLFPYVIDPSEYKLVENIFTFETLREKVRNEFGSLNPTN